MELLIWAGGRWRHVCPTSGRVTGWRRRARLACNRRGVLRELPPLSALASIIKGPALPRIKKPKVKPVPKVNVNTHNGSPYKSFQSAIAVQTITVQKDACIQTDTEFEHSMVSKTVHNNKTQMTLSKTLSQDKDKKSKGNKRTEERNFRSASTEILELRTNIEQNKENEAPKSKEDNVNEDTDTEKSLNDMQKTNRNTESTTSSEDNFKELIIDEQDVLILRQFIETHDTSIDLYRFDVDDYYKMLVFYKINPLVRIDRCARIADMVKDRDLNFTVHFARQLGLRSVNDNAEDEHDIVKRTKHRAAKQAAMMAIDGETNLERAKKNKKIKKYAVVEDSGSDIEGTKKSKAKYEQKTTTLDIDSDQENSKPLRSKTAKKVTKETTDSDSQEKQTKIKKHTAEEVNKNEHEKVKVQKVTKTDENGDREPKILRKRNRIESDVSDSDKVGKIDDKIKKTRHIKPISSGTSDEETFKLSKLRDTLKRNATEMAQDNNQDQNARKKPAVEKDLPKDSEKSSNEENLQPKNKKKFDLGLRRIIIPKRSSVPPGREYSTLEDQAIVSWVSTATQRERAVNGNRIWKELEGGYTKITGQKRSWHSLRNRYLRYILPGLGALAIPSAQAQRLRAHAATGELKARKKTRRNSAFKYPAVRSASARAPRPAIRSPTPLETQKSNTSSDTSESETSDSDSPKRLCLRSSIRTKSPSISKTLSTIKSDNRRQSNKETNHTHTPTVRMQSSNKRANHTQSPTVRTQSSNKRANHAQSPTVRTQSSNKRTNHAHSPSKSLQSRSPRSSPTYSELTRRFALRNRSTPHPSPKPSASHHKRRLYNPQVPPS